MSSRELTVGDRALTVFEGEDEPRVRDTDLATWLAFKQPRAIRRLVTRWTKAGAIAPREQRVTVARCSRSGRPMGTVEVTECWLTEAEALFLAAKSETPRAVEVTKGVIATFVAARRGLLAAPEPPPGPHEPVVVCPVSPAALGDLGALARAYGLPLRTYVRALLENKLPGQAGPRPPRGPRPRKLPGPAPRPAPDTEARRREVARRLGMAPPTAPLDTLWARRLPPDDRAVPVVVQVPWFVLDELQAAARRQGCALDTVLRHALMAWQHTAWSLR